METSAFLTFSMDTDHQELVVGHQEESNNPWLGLSERPALGSPELKRVYEDLAKRIFKDVSRVLRIGVNPYDFKELKKGSFSLTKFYLDKVPYGLKGEDVASANGLPLQGQVIELDKLLTRHDEFLEELKAMKEAEGALQVELRELSIEYTHIEVLLTARTPELEMEESFRFKDVDFVIDRSDGEPHIVSAQYKRKVVTQGLPQRLTKNTVVQIATKTVKEYGKV